MSPKKITERSLDDSELDYLLSQGRLSGPEKERVFDGVMDNVLQEVSPDERHRAIAAADPRAGRRSSSQRQRRWVVALSAIAAMAVVGVLLLDELADPVSSKAPGAFVARGTQEQTASPIEGGCQGGCQRGDTLMFRVHSVPQSVYLAAWSVGPEGKRTWYFPTDDGEMPQLRPNPQPTVLRHGIKLGAEHALGAHALHFLLVAQVETRTQIADRLDNAGASPTPNHWTQRLEIQP